MSQTKINPMVARFMDLGVSLHDIVLACEYLERGKVVILWFKGGTCKAFRFDPESPFRDALATMTLEMEKK